jgi:hypothetical protein
MHAQDPVECGTSPRSMLRRLIRWYEYDDSTLIWWEHDGFALSELSADAYANTNLGRAVNRHLSHFAEADELTSLLGEVQKTIVMWETERAKLRRDNEKQRMYTTQNLPFYDTRMRRLDKNIFWGEVVRACLRDKTARRASCEELMRV